MVDPNWGLLRPDNGANNALAQGFSLGSALRERQDARDQRNALAAYITNKSSGGNGLVETPEQKAESERIWAHLVRTNPELALRVQQQEGQTQQRRIEQRRADLPLIGRLLEHSTDQQTYQQALGTAQQYGIDVSGLPQTFDPAWRDQQLAVVKILQDPAKAEALGVAGRQAADEGYRPGTPEFAARAREIWQAGQIKTIPYTQGGGVAGFNTATGETRTIIAPNPGGFAAGSPVDQGGGSSGGVREGATATNPQTGAKIIYRNGQWQPLTQGGGGGHVTSNFLDGV